jgi:hypothetical protein
MFSRTDQSNKTVISSKHTVDQIGRDAPPVGLYETTTNNIYSIASQKDSCPGF